MNKLNLYTKDVSVIITEDIEFNIEYINTDRNYFTEKIDKEEISIKQNKKTESKYWKRWIHGLPSIVIHITPDIKHIKINSESNKVMINDVTVRDIEGEMGNGKIEISNVDVNVATLQCANGACELINCRVASSCDIRTTNGEICISGLNKNTCNFGYNILCSNGITEIFNATKKGRVTRDGVPFYKLNCVNGRCRIV